MSNSLLLTNARVVTATEVFPGTVQVAGGVIRAVDRGVTSVAGATDLEGDFLLPGLVELHTDNLEKHFTPRPGVRWPSLPAVVAHDAQVVAAGITTVFDALALGDVKDGSARMENLDDMATAVTLAQAENATRAEHFLHLRCELGHPDLTRLFHNFDGNGLVRLVSVMDHAPGQRQFVNLDKYREYYQGKYRLSDAEMDAFMDRQIRSSRDHSGGNRAHIVARCHERGLPLASHDDAEPAHVEEARALGMSIAEFPTTLEAARAARHHGLQVLMGAPNLVRGGSHSGNVSARALAEADLLDIVSSDYFPGSLLQAAFALEESVASISLPDAVARVSRNPARAARLGDRGSIEPGLRGDLVRVHEYHRFPLVREVWRAGMRVY